MTIMFFTILSRNVVREEKLKVVGRKKDGQDRNAIDSLLLEDEA